MVTILRLLPFASHSTSRLTESYRVDWQERRRIKYREWNIYPFIYNRSTICISYIFTKYLLLCAVYVAVKTINLEISRCRLADHIKEFYLSAYRTCSTIIFPNSTNRINVFWCWLCCCRRSSWSLAKALGEIIFEENMLPQSEHER